MTIQRHFIFEEVKRLRSGRAFTADEVRSLDHAIDLAEGARDRRISAAALDLIKRSEGLRLTAYRCPADVPTIGYGSTGPHVRMGMSITEAQAEDLLIHDLERFEHGVSQLAPTATQGQFDALVSFAFNVGFGDPDHKPKPVPGLKTSTLLRLHNAGDYEGAANQFAHWNRGGGRVLPGLVTRRAAEAKLYRGVS